MLNIGTICIKIAGREAGKYCVVVDVIDKKYVLIDGNLRRRKCNIAHLEPTDKSIKITKSTTTNEIHKLLSTISIDMIPKKEKTKTKKEKPSKKRTAKKEKPAEKKDKKKPSKTKQNEKK